jgi:hypothetical protein
LQLLAQNGDTIVRDKAKRSLPLVFGLVMLFLLGIFIGLRIN